jgi:hypothetical protein
MDYYVNRDAQVNGDHEVHKLGCRYSPSNRMYLGDFDYCEDAIREAMKSYVQVNGCYYCCEDCHNS